MSELKKYITTTLDFPSEGIHFKDFFPLLRDHLSQTTDEMLTLTNWDDVDYIAGVESRGFILATALAAKLGKGFIPIRKKGKLPPPIISQSYSLEYGNDIIEMQPAQSENKTIVIVDDVIATGGTLKASIELCQKAGYKVKDTIALIDLEEINDLRNSHHVKSLIQY